MNQETKNCQNCKNQFVIEPDDFVFYEKMKVPPPTFCPDCRLKRRLIQYSKRTLYKRKCDSCYLEVFSMYDPENQIKVFCNICWWSDKWDPTEYGQDYDFSRPFFTQLQELLAKVPWMALGTDSPTLINSDYCNAAGHLKNCYLVFYADYVEDSLYSDTLHHSKNCIDSYILDKCERCYECTNVDRTYQSFWANDCQDSFDIYFSKNLNGCSNCFGCVNLRNKSYYIFNKPYSKEEYSKTIKDFNVGSYANMRKLRKKAEEFFLDFPQKYSHNWHNVNVSGDYIVTSKNVHQSFLVENAEDSKYCLIVYAKGTKDCYDYSFFGDNASQLYECVKCGYGVSNLKFCNGCWSDTQDARYSTFCISSKYIFGCVGLRNKQYYIFNKQYTKEEYEALIPKIIQHMNDMPYTDKKGRVYKYGEYFPQEFSPFTYNETILQEFFPLTMSEAVVAGYNWKNPVERNIKITVSQDQLPDHIKDVEDSIVSEVIACEHRGDCNEQCTTAFKVIPQELQFYKQMNLPLPRLCPNCRHYQRLQQRNPLKLWHRQCMCNTQHQHHTDQCPNEFETSYAPDRPEIVYCEQCYNAEVV